MTDTPSPADEPTDPTTEMPTPPPTPGEPTGESTEAEIERLRAERDTLAAEVEQLRGPRRQGRIRSIAVGALVVLLCVSFLGSVVGVWAKRNALDNQVFTERVAPLGADPAVQAALGTWITAQVMETIDPETIFRESLPDRARILAVPLANVVRGFVGDQVSSFLASDRFAQLWASSTAQAHATAVKILEGDSEVISATGDEIELNLIPVVNAALAQIGQQSPEIFGRTVDLPTLTVDDIPQAAKDELGQALGVNLSEDFGIITIKSGGGALETAQTAVQWITIAVWFLVALTILLVPLILWLSRRRRRTLLQMTAGLLIVTVLLRRLVMTLQSEALSRMQVEVNRAAAEVTFHQFLDPLFSFLAVIAWGLVAIGAVALVTGPYPWARYVRRTARQIGSQAIHTAGNLGERAGNEETIAWLRTNLVALQVAGAVVGVVLLIWLDLSWLRLFLLAVVIGGYELGLWWVAGRDGEAPPGEALDSRPAPPPPPADLAAP